MHRIHWINPDAAADDFPEVSEFSRETDGLLAIGGDLSVDRLLHAYRRGIFPWFNSGQPILWWSPDPRTVLFPDEFRVSRSLARRIRKEDWKLSMDTAFRSVIEQCAALRADDDNGTWISDDMIDAYSVLHDEGWAHSVEVSLGDQLVGGLYGVGMGPIFFGESMFTHVNDASKIALLALCRQLQAWNFRLIDCQVASEHLFSLGAREIPRERFLEILDAMLGGIGKPRKWRFDMDRNRLLGIAP